MVNKFKSLLTIGILILGVSFIATNCQKEDVTTVKETEQEMAGTDLSINYVSGKKIPGIVNLLGGKDGTVSKGITSKSGSIVAPFGTISIENVLEVIDTLGNQNYSFVLLPKTPKPNSIFNLVVNGSSGAPSMAILEYRMAPDFAEAYRHGAKSIAEFSGTVFVFPYSSGSGIFSKSSSDTCIQNIDEIVDCRHVTFNGGSSTGGGGAGSTTIGDISDPQAGNTGGGIVTGGGGTAVWVCSPCGYSHEDPSECTCSSSSGGGSSDTA
ncbi:hypothetical protein [Hyunsoonleella rubra]|uniref:Uncharacterized protein n=1 Tax=Hyunsoonleella rubra TaxID=1737062 RepID=A0ABW5TFV3_9FLAO